MNSKLPLILFTLRLLPFWLAILLLYGCATQEHVINAPYQPHSATVENYRTQPHQRVHDVFSPVRLQTKAAEQHLQVKIDNLLVLIDTSLDKLAPTPYSATFLSAYEALHRFIHSTPALPFETSVFEFGAAASDLESLSFDDQAQNLAQLHPRFALKPLDLHLEKRQRLPSLNKRDLAGALDTLTTQRWQFDQPLTLLIIAPWQQLNTHSLRALKMFKKRMAIHQGVCVYLIGIGAEYSRSLADNARECGFSVSAQWIAQPAEMAHFVERVMYTFPADSDNDGIYDFADRCPTTRPGRIVNRHGCYQFADTRRP